MTLNTHISYTDNGIRASHEQQLVPKILFTCDATEFCDLVCAYMNINELYKNLKY